MNTDPPTSSWRCTSRSALERLAADTANSAAPSTAARSSRNVSAIRVRSGKGGYSGRSATVSRAPEDVFAPKNNWTIIKRRVAALMDILAAHLKRAMGTLG